MKVGRCVCGNTLFFQNTICSACERSVGFLPDSLQMIALEPIEDGYGAAQDTEAHYALCQNQVEHAVCNWLLPATEVPGLCASCRLNHTIPDLSVPQNLAWPWTLTTSSMM